MNPEDIHIKISQGRYGREVIYNGQCFSLQKFAEHIGAQYGALSQGIASAGTEAEEYLKNRVWLLDQGIVRSCRVFKRGDDWLVAADVVEVVGCTQTTALKRCIKWEDGRYTKERLFSKNPHPPGPKPGSPQAYKALWNLGPMQPRRKIKDLKGHPTKWDRKVAGVYAGICLPSEANLNSHRRY